MNRLLPAILMAGITLSIGSASIAREDAPAPLVVGDAAPPLVVSEWLDGEPIEGYERGRIYVIDFWASWCAPCIAGFPHLSELQEQYEGDGVVVIGMASTGAPDRLERIRDIFEKKKEVMKYRVALDDQQATTWKSLMDAAEKNGLPTAFIVDRSGDVAFIGHPSMMDATLQAIVRGETDGKRQATSYQDQLEVEAQMRSFHGLIREARYAEAYEVGWRLVRGPAREQLNMMAGVAWTIVDPQRDLPERDLDLALEAALRVAELTSFEDPGQLDTLAWAHFHRGESEKAIEIEMRALAMAPAEEESLREHLRASLRTFRGQE